MAHFPLKTHLTRGANRAKAVCRASWHQITLFFQKVVAAVQKCLLKIFNWVVLGTKISLLSVAIVVISFIVLCLLIVFWAFLSTSCAATTRYMLLRDIPGSTLVPLAFNVLPLITEWWRSEAIDTAIKNYLPPAVQPSVRLGNNSEIAFGPQSIFTSTAQQVVEKASDIKLALIKEYTESIIATSTLVLPYSDSKKSTLLFSGSSGEVNLDQIFRSPTAPFFSTEGGEYKGEIQLVFLKEEIGLDAALVVEISMLYAEDETDWALSGLKTLFTASQTVHVSTGPPEPRFFRKLWNEVVEFVFYVPLAMYRILFHMCLHNVHAPFPRVDHRREVAVVVPVYTGFSPPLAIRSHLRALNFTIFQQRTPVEKETVQRNGGLLGGIFPKRTISLERHRKVRLSRWLFHSSLRLEGIVYWLTEYPITSFVVLLGVFASLWAAVGVILLGSLLYFFWAVEKDEADEAADLEESNESEASNIFTDETSSQSTVASSAMDVPDDRNVAPKPRSLPRSSVKALPMASFRAPVRKDEIISSSGSERGEVEERGDSSLDRVEESRFTRGSKGEEGSMRRRKKGRV